MLARAKPLHFASLLFIPDLYLVGDNRLVLRVLSEVGT